MAEPTQVVQQQTGFSPEVAPYAQGLIGKAYGMIDLPYQSYRGEQVAQFSPLQQQSYDYAKQMTAAPQLQDATASAGLATLGALNTGYTFNPYQAQSFGANTAQQYMSPYMQNVVDVQQQQAKRQADIAAQTQQAQAARSGAFGGGRDAVMRSQANAELQRNLQGIQATGLQNAYQQGLQQFNTEQQQRQAAAQLNAQQGQFGSSLGMQGLQTALQGAGVLGNLGQTQFAQNMGLVGLQNQLGLQQQQQAQNVLNTQYQNFLNQQNYPYKQIGFASDILRGAPLTQTGSSVYQAAPSTIAQLAGLGMGAYGLSSLFGGSGSGQASKAEGGTVRGYADGGSVTSDENIQDILESLSDQQLASARQDAVRNRDANRVQMIDEEAAKRASIRRGMGSAFNALPQQSQQNVLSAANGGMVAFADGDLVTSDAGDYYAAPLTAQEMGQTDPWAPLKKFADWAGRNVERDPETGEVVRKSAPQAAPAAPSAPAAPAPRFEQAELRKMDQPAAKVPEVKLSRTEKSAASKIGAAVARQSDSKPEDMSTTFQNMLKVVKGSGDSDTFNEMMSHIKEMTKLPEYNRDEALAKFGFALALAGSKPQAGRNKLQGFLGSLAEAGPVALAHREEYDKKVMDAKKLGTQMQIELLKQKMATDKDDRRTALLASQNVQNLQLQREKMLQDAAYHKAALGKPSTGLMAVYEELKRANPQADTETLLRKASEVSGLPSMYRTEAGLSQKRAQMLESARAKDPTRMVLEAQMMGEKDPAKRAQLQAQLNNLERMIQQRVDSALSSETGQPSGPAPMPQGVTVQRIGG